MHAFVGYQVAKDAFGGAFTSENLSIGRQRWRLKRGMGAREGQLSNHAHIGGSAAQTALCGQQACERSLQSAQVWGKAGPQTCGERTCRCWDT